VTAQLDSVPKVSVVIGTHNRCDRLPVVIQSLLAQQADDFSYEVIIVDNNSTDRTREVVESFIARGHENLRYIFEPRQGVSYARNTGIGCARASVIAFTDDDVCVTSNWIATIWRALDQHPEVDFVGGKVLPRYECAPPAWLTREHWSPLAITDFGDAPFYVDAENPRCLVAANLGVRRIAFAQVGLFAPEFPRSQDHEWELRVWNAGRRGMYVPEIIIWADVQAERLTKTYHRKWHNAHGKYCANMQLEERTDPQGHLRIEPPDLTKLYGTPGYVYRQIVSHIKQLFIATLRRREEIAFYNEGELRYYINYICERYWRTKAERQHSHLTEIWKFARDMHRKRRRALVTANSNRGETSD
jgi:glycosyltransferase involved in cell wall biosynthesis